MNSITRLLVIPAAILLIFSASYAQKKIVVSEVNPDFITYQKKIALSGDPGFGYVPHLKKLNTALSSVQRTPLTLPAVYDLRNLGLMTSVKNQGGCGACWSFATFGSLESHWKSIGLNDYDLSENNLKDCHTFDWGPCYGGNSWLSIAYLSTFAGPVRESEDPYVAYPAACVTGNTPLSRQVQARMLPKNNEAIKQAIMDYGAVYTAFCWTDAAYNSSNYTYYYSGSSLQNHAVVIAGWDDTKVTAGGTGAWIIKNSWGPGWGQSGYFYISYNDSRMNEEVCYYPSYETVNPQSTLYNYDDFGDVLDLGFNSETAYGMIKFTTTNDLPVTRISTWTSNFNGNLSIEVYDDFDGTTLINLLSVIPEQPAPEFGYYTFYLPSPLNLGSGNDFYVRIKYHTDNYLTPIPTEAVYPGYSSNAVIETGKCWISEDGNSWNPIGNGTGYPHDLCIKAYAANEPEAPVVTAGSVSSCPEEKVVIPLNVTGFTAITSMKLEMEYDISEMSFDTLLNLHDSLEGLIISHVPVSGNQHRIMISWKRNRALMLPSGSDMFDLLFTYHSGDADLSFNNEDHYGWNCEFTDNLHSTLYDNPASEHYINGGIAPLSAHSSTWTGTISSDWDVAGNWNPALVPDCASDVIIPAGTPHLPQINSSFPVIHDLQVSSSSLGISASGIIRVRGDIVVE